MAEDAADFKDAVRNPALIGGDTDTIACISLGIAEARALFDLPAWIAGEALAAYRNNDGRVLRETMQKSGAVGLR